MTPPRSRLPAALAAAALLLAAASAARAESPCLECHDKTAVGSGERSVHPPFRENDCEACHNGHEARDRFVLRGAALCGQCHAGREGGFLRAHPGVSGVAGSRFTCVSCHDPHRSTEPRLLLPNRHRPLAYGICDDCHRFDGRLVRAVPALCLGCHAGEEFSRPLAHGPIRKGECLVCHDPHAAREGSLLRRRFSAGRTIAGEADVDLCFGCHPPRAFFAEGADLTLFRDGERNLHRLHVAGGSRRLSCRNCHEFHTAEEPKLVRRELDCDGVPCLRLEYRRVVGGGQCLSGCHGPQSYAFADAAPAPPEAAAPAAPPPGGRRRAAAAPVPRPTDLQRSLDRRCVGCHEEDVRRFAGGSRVHGPVRAGACSTCHLDHGPENRLILLGPVDRVCGTCHPLADPGVLAAHRDFPLAGADCTECHDPHGANRPALLLPALHAPFEEGDCRACHGAPAQGWRVAGAGETCRGCHEEAAAAPHLHPAIPAQGCRGCHRPHAGREPGLLRADGGALCLRCHDAGRFAGATVHPPVQEGDCAACHPPHGSAEPGLLAGPYPLERFVPYRDGAYDLCWGCHEPSLTDPEEAAGGGFAAGGRNLHALHVRDRVSMTAIGRRVQPGISCRNCHDPHATEDPRLVRRSLDCDGVPCLQLEFRKAGEGGRCSRGCHAAETYGTEP